MSSPRRKRRFVSSTQRAINEWRGISEPPEGMRQAQEMQDLIPETLTKLRTRNRFTEEEVCAAWTEILPKEPAILARHTRPTGLRRGVLHVSVVPGAARYAIVGMKDILLQRLQERFGAAHVQDLQFKVG